jgi:hypothetical protein
MLDPNYKKFITEGGELTKVLSEVTDRMQYSPGFFNELQHLLEKHESPFEGTETFKVLKTNFKPEKVGSNAA